MRVALLTREFPPEVYGGAGVHVEHLSAELAKRVEVGVYCFGAERTNPLVARSYGPWDVFPLRPEATVLQALASDLRMAGDVADMAGRLVVDTDHEQGSASETKVAGLGVETANGRLLEGVAVGAELVHSHTWYANMGGHLAKLMWDIPHVMTAHSLEPLRPWKAEALRGGYRVSSWCEQTAIEAADAVVAVSASMREDLLAAYPALDPARVVVIHNGIDAEEYSPDPGTEVIERLGIDLGRPYVMFIGRVTRQKGIEYLLSAGEQVEPGTQLVFCAGAPDTPAIGEEMRTKARRLAERRGGVFWIEAMIDRRDAVQLLSHASVFVCPSIYEPFGLINLEAMACATPVVATATGGIPEIVVEGVTGHLVGFRKGSDAFGTPADPEGFASGLARALNDLLADPDTAQAMGRAGRQRVLEKFTWAAIADRTVELYADLLSPSGSGARTKTEAAKTTAP